MKFQVTGRREALYSSLKRAERRTLGTTNLSASLLCLGRSWKIPFLFFKPPQSLPVLSWWPRAPSTGFRIFAQLLQFLLYYVWMCGHCSWLQHFHLSGTWFSSLLWCHIPPSNAPCPVAKSYTSVAKKEAADRCREMKGEDIPEKRQQRP